MVSHRVKNQYFSRFQRWYGQYKYPDLTARSNKQKLEKATTATTKHLHDLKWHLHIEGITRKHLRNVRDLWVNGYWSILIKMATFICLQYYFHPLSFFFFFSFLPNFPLSCEMLTEYISFSDFIFFLYLRLMAKVPCLSPIRIVCGSS